MTELGAWTNRLESADRDRAPRSLRAPFRQTLRAL